MAEKVIRNNESIVPFFGERLSFIRGLDPLALQNTSDATFSQLLPGLNNVTGRIRYYSFYCWLLDMYSQEVGSTNPQHQKQFIRRAEFIIALASQYLKGDASNIPGSNYAKKEIFEKEITTHNLQAATFKSDGATRDTYWNYPTGAFGQYYLGSLRDIGIVAERTNHAGIYIRTNSFNDQFISGEMLANAFNDNIKQKSKLLFLRSIDGGSITEEELIYLLVDFDLTIVPENSKEQELLLKLLLQKDFPARVEESNSTFRKQTIKLLLEFGKENNADFTDRSFTFYAYDVKGKKDDKTDECLMGWYFYQFNEFWHFSNTSILNGTLDYLENTVGPSWIYLPNLLRSITEKVIQNFIQIGIPLIRDSNLDSLLGFIKNYDMYRCLEQTSSAVSVEKVCHGFLMVLTLYLENSKELFELKEYAADKNVDKDGEGSEYYTTILSKSENEKVYDFIYNYLHLNIIYRHQYVAFRKIGAGSLSTQKFIIEDQHIRYLGNFEAGFTGPRVGRLIGFLGDLGVVNNNNVISAQGLDILNN